MGMPRNAASSGVNSLMVFALINMSRGTLPLGIRQVSSAYVGIASTICINRINPTQSHCQPTGATAIFTGENHVSFDAKQVFVDEIELFASEKHLFVDEIMVFVDEKQVFVDEIGVFADEKQFFVTEK